MLFGLSGVVMAAVFLLSTVLQVLGLPQLVGALPGDETASVDDVQVAGLIGGGTLAFVVPLLLQGLATIVLTAVLILAVSDAVVGRKPSVGEVVRRMLPRVWAVIGVSLLSGFVLLALYAVVALPAVLLFVAGSTVGGVVAVLVGLLVLVLLGPFLWVRLAFAGPALLLENIGVWASLRRSWRLSVGSWWRCFGILLLTAIIAGAVGGLVTAPFAVIGSVLGAVSATNADVSLSTSQVIGTVLQNLGSVVATTITAPFSAAVVALLYIDLRMRREGLDVALARAAAEAPPS
nr:hypothetical protein [Angustibacter aerolatus]